MNATRTQQAAIGSNDPLNIIIAGPGSGKTSTMIARIMRLIREGTPPSEIVAITFTNAAARDIESRLRGLLLESGFQPDMRSHRQMNHIVKLGYAGTLHGFLLRLIQERGTAIGFTGPVTIYDELQVQELVKRLITEHRWKGSAEAVTEALKIGPGKIDGCNTPLDLLRQDYYQRLLKSNVVDFDGILHYGLKLVKLFPEMPYSHLFVDEFQDSSAIDAQIYRYLKIPNKFYVGDIDQSIYAFRGGSPSIMLNLLRGESGSKFVLVENFRCDRSICDAANKLISNNVARFDKTTQSTSKHKGIVSVSAYDAPVQEMSAIAHSIQSLPKDDTVAILTRSNAQANEIASFIESIGIRVARKVRMQFPSGWQACRALLAVLTNPDNDDLAYQFIKTHVSENQANRLKLMALQKFCSINSLAFRFIPGTPMSLLPQLLADARIDEQAIAFVKEGIARLDDPDKATASELIYTLSADEMRDVEQGSGVVCCTIHQAKGREWDVVFLPGWERGMFPVGKADIEEERRLAFVAITRAKHCVQISHCRRRARQWQKDDSALPSQFLQEIACPSNVIA